MLKLGVALLSLLLLSLYMSARASGADLFVFQGKFENVDVRFGGNSLSELLGDCYQWAQKSSLQADDLEVFGRLYHNNEETWDTTMLCGLAAVNAQRTDGAGKVKIQGLVEFAPFSMVAASVEELRELIGIYLPIALGHTRVDDLVIGGQKYRNDKGYWNAVAVARIVQFMIEPTKVPVISARGKIQTVPFIFFGDSAREIRQQCSVAMQDVFRGPPRIDLVVVNGITRTNPSDYWSATDACLIVSALAK